MAPGSSGATTGETGRATRGDVARAALVESAERLFAARGVEGVSLRDVSAAAGQRNHSAAQYHFGDRHGLVAAVYERRMGEVDARRRVVLEALGAEGRDGGVGSLVDALVRPLVEVVAASGGWYGRFLARTRWEPEAWRVVVELPVSASFTAVVRALDVALADDLPASLRRSRIDQLGTLLVGTVAGWEGAAERGESRLTAVELAGELVATGVGVLTAPVLAGSTASSDPAHLPAPAGAPT